MTIKEMKENNYKSYTELEKWLHSQPTSILEIHNSIQLREDFKNFTYVGLQSGILEFNYKDMTLKIIEKNGIISLENSISLWNSLTGQGFLGNFTAKTLHQDIKNELD